jgi:hypothetical protein
MFGFRQIAKFLTKKKCGRPPGAGATAVPASPL